MREPHIKTRESNSNTSGRIIVVGIVRDIESTFKRDFDRLSLAFASFQRIDWFLVESGSSDNSMEVLEGFARAQSNFHFKHIELNKNLTRTENMALARNSYLEFLRNNSLYQDYDFVVMADFNNLNNKINSNSVMSCFSQSSWDVVTANQKGKYYDSWALRHPLWSPNDCWEQHAFFRKYTKFPEQALTYAFRSRMLKIPKESEWIEVDSAFGGLAIYKASLFKSAALYSGITKTGQPICEHVPFHLSLKATGVKIFINPMFINTRVTDHSKRISFLYTILRIFRYSFKIFTFHGRKK